MCRLGLLLLARMFHDETAPTPSVGRPVAQQDPCGGWVLGRRALQGVEPGLALKSPVGWPGPRPAGCWR